MNVQFDIPEGYFENLPDRLIQRIEFEDNQKKRKRHIILKRLCFSAAAVLCAGVFCLPLINSGALNENKNSAPDYYIQYASDLLEKSGDVTALYYTSMDETFYVKADLTDILNDYPSPITINEYYD
jgi:hypothetical protein